MRIATYSSELTRRGPGLLLRDILSRKDPQIEATLAVLLATRPDVLLLTDFDQDPDSLAAQALAQRLAEAGLALPHVYTGPSPRGMPSGLDLDGDGRLGEPEDSIGFGQFPGNGGMAVLSRFPFLPGARDLSGVMWSALPGNLRADVAQKVADQPLSSSGHWIVPLDLPGGPLTLLAFHAAPPVFDGPEDRNGRRNHDEIRLWGEVLDNSPPEALVLLGNANADPFDGEGRKGGIGWLLTHPALQDPAPESGGARLDSKAQGGLNAAHQGPPAQDTVDWPDSGRGPGNLRVDYVLPARGLTVQAAGTHWPAPGTEAAETAATASRHALVWVDIDWP
ncbi:endonuclease/exonuclease/phosphatase family protein [Pseudoruegeria sp. SHC-113]|uniref:endonuclease/exonuclease/phosphatase family protein n=1 Tax=Pseudoruegeria sp. SHC-113 TaxID=2855439 RepID=UPI0021BA7F6D|nr:endonuclease/exonuclease/phosphatase family protein [Pseudoruegeria sp. SHC-113]